MSGYPVCQGSLKKSLRYSHGLQRQKKRAGMDGSRMFQLGFCLCTSIVTQFHPCVCLFVNSQGFTSMRGFLLLTNLSRRHEDVQGDERVCWVAQANRIAET